MKDIILVLVLSLTVAAAGHLKSDNNLNTTDPTLTQKYISLNK